MQKQRYLSTLQEIISNNDIDESFVNALNRLVLKVKNNPELSIDIAYDLNNILNNYEFRKIVSKKENNNYIIRNWSSFVYGLQTTSSAFGSYNPLELKKYGYLNVFGNNFGQIYKDIQGNIHLKYQPNSIIKEIDVRSRNTYKNQYIELVLMISIVKMK